MTGAVVANAAVPASVVAISPSATSPALTTLDDRDLFFRTAPSDARQGEVLAKVAVERGITKVALTDTNHDDGAGLASSFSEACAALGSKVLMSAVHEVGKADDPAEMAALDSGAFGTFILADGMLADGLGERVGAEIDDSFGTTPGSGDPLSRSFEEMAGSAGITGTGPRRGEAQDAAALILLAMQAAGSTDRDAFGDRILDIADTPGEPIGAGEIARGLGLLAAGQDIDWQGATGAELTPEGHAAFLPRRHRGAVPASLTPSAWCMDRPGDAGGVIRSGPHVPPVVRTTYASPDTLPQSCCRRRREPPLRDLAEHLSRR